MVKKRKPNKSKTSTKPKKQHVGKVLKKRVQKTKQLKKRNDFKPRPRGKLFETTKMLNKNNYLNKVWRSDDFELPEKSIQKTLDFYTNLAGTLVGGLTGGHKLTPMDVKQVYEKHKMTHLLPRFTTKELDGKMKETTWEDFEREHQDKKIKEHHDNMFDLHEFMDQSQVPRHQQRNVLHSVHQSQMNEWLGGTPSIPEIRGGPKAMDSALAITTGPQAMDSFHDLSTMADQDIQTAGQDVWDMFSTRLAPHADEKTAEEEVTWRNVPAKNVPWVEQTKALDSAGKKITKSALKQKLAKEPTPKTLQFGSEKAQADPFEGMFAPQIKQEQQAQNLNTAQQMIHTVSDIGEEAEQAKDQKHIIDLTGELDQLERDLASLMPMLEKGTARKLKQQLATATKISRIQIKKGKETVLREERTKQFVQDTEKDAMAMDIGKKLSFKTPSQTEESEADTEEMERQVVRRKGGRLPKAQSIQRKAFLKEMKHYGFSDYIVKGFIKAGIDSDMLLGFDPDRPGDIEALQKLYQERTGHSKPRRNVLSSSLRTLRHMIRSPQSTLFRKSSAPRTKKSPQRIKESPQMMKGEYDLSRYSPQRSPHGTPHRTPQRRIRKPSASVRGMNL